MVVRAAQALEFGEIKQMADKAGLFKFVIHTPLLGLCFLFQGADHCATKIRCQVVGQQIRNYALLYG